MNRLFRFLLFLLVIVPPACSRDPADDGSLTDDIAAIPDRAEEPAQSRNPGEGAVPAVLFAAPRFQLTDQAGREFGSAQLDGRVWIVNFMFTRCAATCPRQTEQLAMLQQRTRRYPDRDRIRLLSITVDPEYDTPARLQEYAARHHADDEHWKFLTGDRAELWKLSKEGFKLPVSDATARDATSPITHSARFILVDAQSRVRGYYDSLSDDEFRQLHDDLRFVLSESSPLAGGPTHVPYVPDVLDPLWIEPRAAAQLATKDEIGVDHDFHFVDRLPESGIRFVNASVPDAGRNLQKAHYDHGNGLAAADVDGDRLTDLYFVSQLGGNQLWRNLGGGRFEDITSAAGVGLRDRVSVSASFADTDNDGDQDLYVTTTRQGNAFFKNDGQGCFRDVTIESGLAYTGHSSSAEFFDYDCDGRLDLFLTNVGQFTTDELAPGGSPEHREQSYFLAKADAFAGHLFPDRTERNILYHNDGNNRFRDVTEECGLMDEGWSGDATPFDANGDGWTDLYVLNMQGNDEFYINNEGRRFERQSEQYFSGHVWGGMGVKSLDYNNDGRMDLFITNMHADMWELREDINGAREKLKPPPGAVSASFLHSRFPLEQNILGNALYEGRGGAPFHDVSDQRSAENFWPWGPSAGDLNADGWQDLFLASSMNYPYRYQVNSLLLNDRGHRFRDAEFILGIEPRRESRTATRWFELDCSGADADHPLCQGRTGTVVVWGALGTRSAVIFDLDQDGDLDLVTNDFNSPPQVFVSDLAQRRPGLRYLKVRLRGTRANRDGLGALVQVSAAGKVLTQVNDGQSGYLSQSSLSLYFGLGDADVVDEMSVQWPGGVRQVLTGPIETNQRLVIVEAPANAEAGGG